MVSYPRQSNGVLVRIVFIGASGFRSPLPRAHDWPAKLRGCWSRHCAGQLQDLLPASGVTNVLHVDVRSCCESLDIPCEELVAGMNDPALLERVQLWKPDIFTVVGWYHTVPGSWRRLAPAYGLHASLLPDYSGGAPLVWAIINGEKRTGITLFQFADGVDSVPIVGSAATDILYDDTIATLYARIQELGLQLLVDHLPRLADGTAMLQAQDESQRWFVRQRRPEDGFIDWQLPAERVRDFVRAQTHPYPGAYALFRGESLRVWDPRAVCSSAHELPTGKVMLDENRVIVGCNASALEMLTVGIGTEVMPAIDGWQKGQ